MHIQQTGVWQLPCAHRFAGVKFHLGAAQGDGCAKLTIAAHRGERGRGSGAAHKFGYPSERAISPGDNCASLWSVHDVLLIEILQMVNVRCSAGFGG